MLDSKFTLEHNSFESIKITTRPTTKCPPYSCQTFWKLPPFLHQERQTFSQFHSCLCVTKNMIQNTNIPLSVHSAHLIQRPKILWSLPSFCTWTIFSWMASAFSSSCFRAVIIWKDKESKTARGELWRINNVTCQACKRSSWVCQCLAGSDSGPSSSSVPTLWVISLTDRFIGSYHFARWLREVGSGFQVWVVAF